MSETLRDKYPLEKTKPLKKTISSYIGLTGVILTFITLIITSSIAYGRFSSFEKERLSSLPLNNSPSLILSTYLLIIFLLFITFILVYGVLRYTYEVFYMKTYFYDLVGKNLKIRKGVFSTNEIILPLNRIKDVYVDQDMLDIIFGLYDVHVSTATMSSEESFNIDGLNKENAQKVKELILSKINKEEKNDK